MRLGLHSSASRKYTLLDTIKRESLPLHHYRDFRKVFGKDNYRLLFADDFILGKDCPVYALTDDIKPFQVDEDPSFDIFLTGTVRPNNKSNFITPKDIETQVHSLEMMLKESRAKKIINNPHCLYEQDKAKLSELKEFNMPKTYTTTDEAELSEILGQEETLIAKPRFGFGGWFVDRIQNKSGLKPIVEKGIENFVFQVEIDHIATKRLIFYDNEIVAARIISDPRRPWDEKRSPIIEPYIPTEEEIEKTFSIAKKTGFKLGCSDWMDTEKEQFLLEANGSGVALGYPEGPYDINEKVARLILAEEI